jgi:hypothetical protein
MPVAKVAPELGAAGDQTLDGPGGEDQDEITGVVVFLVAE